MGAAPRAAPYALLREDMALNTHSATTRLRGPKSAMKRPVTVPVSDDTIAQMTEVFKLLADKSRMKILLALAHDGEMHVSALCDMLEQSQPAVSHHLTLMRLTGLVSFRREGKNNYYRLECDFLRDLLDQVFDDCGNGSKQIRFDNFALAYKRGR
jgi:DNA-binding transcriptional ArsR family regulator